MRHGRARRARKGCAGGTQHPSVTGVREKRVRHGPAGRCGVARHAGQRAVRLSGCRGMRKIGRGAPGPRSPFCTLEAHHHCYSEVASLILGPRNELSDERRTDETSRVLTILGLQRSELAGRSGGESSQPGPPPNAREVVSATQAGARGTTPRNPCSSPWRPASEAALASGPERISSPLCILRVPL